MYKPEINVQGKDFKKETVCGSGFLAGKSERGHDKGQKNWMACLIRDLTKLLYKCSINTTTFVEEWGVMPFYMRRLPDAELEIMQAIWDCEPPASRADIEEIVNRKHPLASTTILTLLSRLVEKGVLRAEKNGRSNLYTPLISRQDYLAAQSRSFVEKLCGGDIHLFATALCDSGLSKEEIEELRSLLERDAL